MNEMLKGPWSEQGPWTELSPEHWLVGQLFSQADAMEADRGASVVLDVSMLTLIIEALGITAEQAVNRIRIISGLLAASSQDYRSDAVIHRVQHAADLLLQVEAVALSEAAPKHAWRPAVRGGPGSFLGSLGEAGAAGVGAYAKSQQAQREQMLEDLKTRTAMEDRVGRTLASE